MATTLAPIPQLLSCQMQGQKATEQAKRDTVELLHGWPPYVFAAEVVQLRCGKNRRTKCGSFGDGSVPTAAS